MASPKPTTTPKTILIVDDQPVVLKVLAARLGAQGYRVVTAFGGRDGLTKARKERPDLVILDLMMPDLEGGEVAQALREDEGTEKIPVIFLSGLVSSRENGAPAPGGKQGVMVPKDHKPEELLSAVRRLIG
jgi:CheY-like chemotaxis protein